MNSVCQLARVFTGASSKALKTTRPPEPLPTPAEGVTSNGFVNNVWRRHTACKLFPRPILCAKIAPWMASSDSCLKLINLEQTFFQQNDKPSTWCSFSKTASGLQTVTGLEQPSTSRTMLESSYAAKSFPISSPLIQGESWLEREEYPPLILVDRGWSWARFLIRGTTGGGWSSVFGGIFGWYSCFSPERRALVASFRACFLKARRDSDLRTTRTLPFRRTTIEPSFFVAAASSLSVTHLFSRRSRSILSPRLTSSNLTAFLRNLKSVIQVGDMSVRGSIAHFCASQ